MEYFSIFPFTEFEGKRLTNITLRVDFFDKIKDNLVIYEYVDIPDGAKPEDMAVYLYQDPNLMWVLLWINNIVDVYTEWPLDTNRLMDMVIEKYTEDNIYAVHHYEAIEGSDLPIGTVVNQGTPFSTSVSNFTFEDRENEKKRRIKVLKPDYISQVLAEYRRLF